MTGIYQNGYTETSAVSEDIYACNPPELLQPPILISVDSTEISLKWDYPERASFCPVLGFALYMNDGEGGDTYTEIDSSAIRDKPHYLEHTTTAASVPGNFYYFKVAAYNSNGLVYSESVGFTLGEKPDQPSVAPESITTLTSSERISISVETVTVDSATTPPILSYSIEIDNGFGDDFTTLFGEFQDTLSTTANVFSGVVKG